MAWSADCVKHLTQWLLKHSRSKQDSLLLSLSKLRSQIHTASGSEQLTKSTISSAPIFHSPTSVELAYTPGGKPGPSMPDSNAANSPKSRHPPRKESQEQGPNTLHTFPCGVFSSLDWFFSGLASWTCTNSFGAAPAPIAANALCYFRTRRTC